MADNEMEIADLARLIKLVETKNLSELIVEEGERRIVIRGASYRALQGAPPAPQPQAAAEPDSLPAVHAPEPVQEPEPAEEDERIPITSPVVGVFYRSSSPDTPVFVEIGDRVEVGQVVGLIEAMKVFSEIKAEAAGRVVDIPAANGTLVRVGDPLIYLTP